MRPRNRRRPYRPQAYYTTDTTVLGSITQTTDSGVAYNTTSSHADRLIAPWRLAVARTALRGGDALFQLAKWIIR